MPLRTLISVRQLPMSDAPLPRLQMPPLSMLTFRTFQLREWHDAFWAYRWLFIYGGSSVWDNPLSHRRSTRRAGLRIRGLFTQLLIVNTRADVCFHKVTPPCLADRTAVRGIIKAPQTGVMRL
jgi:hypothetical protein